MNIYLEKSCASCDWTPANHCKTPACKEHPGKLCRAPWDDKLKRLYEDGHIEEPTDDAYDAAVEDERLTPARMAMRTERDR